MAIEIPKDLIKKVQALLRKESGLSSTYDHHDPSIHPLPSLDASIPELHKFMPENPRCKNCDAKFLRGTHSLICIYCGSKIQIKDNNVPDPISFNSSFGCQWLLHSLDLDQSESVRSCNEDFVLNKGHRPKKQEISLHDLLDFHITLSDESEKPKTSVTNKALEQSRSLNLTGAYLGNIFSKSPSIICSALEEPVAELIESSRCQTCVGEEKLASLSSISTGDSVVGTPKNIDFKVSRQGENFNRSVDTKDGSSPGNIAPRHYDVAECVDNINQCQVNNNSAPSDSTTDGHRNSLDK